MKQKVTNMKLGNMSDGRMSKKSSIREPAIESKYY